MAGPDDLFLHKYTNTGSGNVIDNNLYYSATPAGWIWNTTDGAPYMDFSAWKAATGVDANSIAGTNPMLTQDYRIPENSPAKQAGHTLPAEVLGTVDFSGQPRVQNNKVSIGAHQ